AQAEADEAMVQELEESAELPEGKKKVDYFYTEADGVFVRDVKKKKKMEVSHAISYEVWRKMGSRLSLLNPKLFRTTNPLMIFGKRFKPSQLTNTLLKRLKLYRIVMVGMGIQLKGFRKHFHNLNCLYCINWMPIIFNKLLIEPLAIRKVNTRTW